MKIVHCCLSNFFIDGYTYQENMLVREHVQAGHEVLVLASTETFDDNKNLSYLEPSSYIGKEGAKVIRLPYSRYLPHYAMTKFRVHPGVYNAIDEFKPDVILFHGACGWELITVSRYAKKNKNVKLFVDSHEDSNNSARNFIARLLLYKLFYVPIIKFSKRYVEKFLYITYETKMFCKSVYGLEDDALEFYPLGGVVLSDVDYYEKRNSTRLSLEIFDADILFFQSGKFDEKKKLLESLRAFKSLSSQNSRLIIAGSFAPSIETEAKSLIDSDPRITFLGWANSEQLLELLCAADVYVQPGSQSATLQMSIAARCAVIIDDVPSHRDIFRDNGFLVKDEKQLAEAMQACSSDKEQLAVMSQNSLEFANQKLNYAVLAARLLK